MVSIFPYLFLNASLRDFFNAIFLRPVKEAGTKNLMRRRERRVQDSTSRAVGLENSGVTSEKSKGRDALVDSLHVIVPNLHSVANAGTDESLKKLTSLTDSDISTKREADLRDYANQVYKAATANATALADFGDDADTIAGLRTLIDNFNKLIGQSGDIPEETVNARGVFYAKFPVAENALKDIDNAIKGYMTKDPDYYNEYTLLRPVKAHGVRHNPKPTNTPQAAPAK